MEAEATIIDLRRASARKRMARSRAKQKEAKRAAKRMIREREASVTIIDLRRSDMAQVQGITGRVVEELSKMLTVYSAR